MEALSPIKHTERRWKMLLVYSCYRFIGIFILLGVYWYDHPAKSNVLLLTELAIYFIIAIIGLILWSYRTPKITQQILWLGTADVIILILLIHTLGYIQTGLGVLMYASIAVLSILAPGKLAIYFAAIASCMFLGINVLQFLEGVHPSLTGIFYAGIYSAGFFATALTAWYLATWVQSSEMLALMRARELGHMQRLYEYIVNRLQYGVIYIDMNGEMTVVNEAACKFFNYQQGSKQMPLQRLSESLHQKYLQFITKKKHKEKQTAQTMLKEPPLQVHFYGSVHGSTHAVLIILEDLTKISQQAQQLKLASLGRLSASIAHELRNPLGVISHAVQLLGESNVLSKEDLRLKELIENHCLRMNEVIKNVLQLSRGQISKPEKIHLEPFLHAFKQDFVAVDRGKSQITFSNIQGKHLFFDKSQLQQVLIILCDNAVKYGQDKEGKVTIHIAYKENEPEPCLVICDKGPGVAEEIKGSIFDPFFTTLPTGYGMGLFIAKDLCESNQANLSLVDTVHGACFKICIKMNHEMLL